MEQALKPESQGNVAVEPVAWGLGDLRRARAFRDATSEGDAG